MTSYESLTNQRDLSVGQVVQLGPETRNKMFAFCLMVVTEPRSWGAQGFVQALGENGNPGGQAYYRAEWEEMETCENGLAPFLPASHGEVQE